VANPFPAEEWSYRLDGELVGLGHVDALPVGLSAIYFVHDPDLHRRGLGTWNILCMIDEARRRGLPHVYLGYWVADCPSLSYKANFRPHEILGAEGRWHPA
jgi:arginine-tRNA-protein transferase